MLIQGILGTKGGVLRHRLFKWVPATGLVLLAVLSACEQPGVPEREPDVVLNFLPTSDRIQITASSHADFQVQSNPAVSLETHWLVDGVQVGEGPRFRYLPAGVGTREIQVRSSYEYHESGRSWDVEVQPEPDDAVGFVPAGNYLELSLGVEQEFGLALAEQVDVSARWWINGQAVADGVSYRYQAAGEGLDTLLVEVTGLVQRLDHQWRVRTRPLWYGVHFSPPLSNQSLVATQELEFKVIGSSYDTQVSWFQDGAPAGSGPDFTFTAGAAPSATVQAVLSCQGETLEHDWTINIHPLGTCPPPTTGIHAVDYGPGPNELLVRWWGVADGVFPLADYTVLFSADGPITPETAGQAHQAGPVAHLGRGEVHTCWITGAAGLELGGDLWLALRSRDGVGQVSEDFYNIHETTVANWTVTGRVLDSEGQPLSGALVQGTRSGHQTWTDSQGWFELGPQSPGLPEPILVSGEAGSPFYAFRSDTLGPYTPLEHTMVLPTRLGAAPGCLESQGDFLTYLRHMTRTSLTTVLRPEHRLYRWDEYPLRAYIPPLVNEQGIDYQEAARWSLALWNAQAGGEPLFTETTDPEQAQLVWDFVLDGNLANGQVVMLEPRDQPYSMGDAIPQRMRVYISPELEVEQRVRETMLHELGHALGLYRHSQCSNMGYLMYVTAGGALDDGPEHAIHQDELNAVRTIRALPQGVNMAGYRLP